MATAKKTTKTTPAAKSTKPAPAAKAPAVTIKPVKETLTKSALVAHLAEQSSVEAKSV